MASLLKSHIVPGEYYASCLDLGCGSGRFIPILSSFCGHVWAVDIVEELMTAVEYRSPAATAWYIDQEYRLPDGPHDFLWSAFCFQHMTKDHVFDEVCHEIRRVMKKGARIFLLENAKDRASHVRPRTPDEYAKGLNLAQHTAKLVTVNKKLNDHWWIEGRVR